MNSHLIEIKPVSIIGLQGGSQKGGIKNEGKSAEVIENKCRKNVSSWPWAEVTENKAIYSFPQNMLMKRNGVIENGRDESPVTIGQSSTDNEQFPIRRWPSNC